MVGDALGKRLLEKPKKKRTRRQNEDGLLGDVRMETAGLSLDCSHHKIEV
jgi:hypothetical protein